jgi:hypothetical protein
MHERLPARMYSLRCQIASVRAVRVSLQGVKPTDTTATVQSRTCLGDSVAKRPRGPPNALQGPAWQRDESHLRIRTQTRKQSLEPRGSPELERDTCGRARPCEQWASGLINTEQTSHRK